MTSASVDPPARGGRHLLLVGLLAAAIFINYVDRGNLATAAPLLKDELKLSNAQIGLLASAFFWTYAPAQLCAAWLVGRVGAHLALALGLALWSLATLLSGLAGSFYALLALRVLLGVGESAGFPASSKLLIQHLPHRLGSANALVSAALSLGPAFGTFVGGLLVAHTGWRMLFVLFGAASLLWLLPWLGATRSLSDRPGVAVARGREPPFAELLRRPELWGAAIGHFANNYAFYVVLTWLPLYLVKAHGYSLVEMARLGGLVYAVSAVTGLGWGVLADRLTERGADPGRVRLTMMCGGLVIGLVGMLACGLGGPGIAIAGLLTYSIFHGLSSFNNFAIGQTLAGPAAAARWMGVQNGVANIAGIVAPVLTGVIIDRTGRFSLGFLTAAGVLLLGLFGWTVLVRRVRPLDWSTDCSSASPSSEAGGLSAA